jgi:hypothetical protein
MPLLSPSLPAPDAVRGCAHSNDEVQNPASSQTGIAGVTGNELSQLCR